MKAKLYSIVTITGFSDLLGHFLKINDNFLEVEKTL